MEHCKTHEKLQMLLIVGMVIVGIAMTVGMATVKMAIV